MQQWDKIELRLNSHRNFREVPKDLLMYLSLNDEATVAGMRERKPKIVRLDMRNNKLVQLRDDFFESIDETAKASIEALLASQNQLISVSNKLELLHGLSRLDLSHNQLLKAPHFPANLNELRLSHNNLHKLPRLSLPHLTSLDVTNNHL